MIQPLMVTNKDPGVDAPTTPVVKPRRNWGYDKYKSSKKYYEI